MKEDTKPWLVDWEEQKGSIRGGQGVITKLRHKTNIERLAMLKTIVPRWQGNEQARKRLQKEAETLLKLNDLKAHVPKVYDSFMKYDTAEPFLLMEFIDGIRFDEWLRTKAPVTPDKAVLIVQGIAKTIGLCHQHQIGHRDLKPSNIILKGGEISSPYVLDFGIAFDSRQTIILTHEGEMFWNEFIILPECQDLEGGHRDLRSDITALAGIFFACLTGKPPIVLRDAQELAPHQRHEHSLRNSAKTVEQGEHLAWFFDRAFAYRINKRFQTLEEFTGELVRFADSSSVTNLDLVDQFAILDQEVQSTDRNVQLAALRDKYQKVLTKVVEQITNESMALKQLNGRLRTRNISITDLQEFNRPNVNGGNALNEQNALAFFVSRNHFDHIAVALLMPFSVGMQIHLYSTSYCAPSGNIIQMKKSVTWAKIAILDENIEKLSEEKLSVIVSALKSKLTHEITNLVREKKR